MTKLTLSTQDITELKKTKLGSDNIEYDSSALSNAKSKWIFGQWSELAGLSIKNYVEHPEREKIALLIAAAHQQLGNMDESVKHIQLSRSWGADNAFVAKVLISGVKNTLGRIYLLNENQERASQNFKESMSLIVQSNEVEQLQFSRTVNEMGTLGLLPDSVNTIGGNKLDLSARPVNIINKIESVEVALSAKRSVAPKIIFVASMPRSGSTWLFNCVKFCFDEAGKVYYSDWIKDYNRNRNERIHIIKVHKPSDCFGVISNAALILTTVRNIYDVAASLRRMGWLKKEEFIRKLDEVVFNIYPYWESVSDLEIHYSEIENSSIDIIKRITEKLDIELSDESLQSILERLESLSSPDEYDSNTQLHPNHRAKLHKHFSTYLDQEEIATINKRYYNFNKVMRD